MNESLTGKLLLRTQQTSNAFMCRGTMVRNIAAKSIRFLSPRESLIDAIAVSPVRRHDVCGTSMPHAAMRKNAALIHHYFDAGSDGARRRGSTLQVARELLIGADPVKTVHKQIDSGHCCPRAICGSAGVSSRAQAYLYALDGRCLRR